MNIVLIILVILSQALDLATSLYSRKFWPSILEKTAILRDARGSFSIPKGIVAKVGLSVLLVTVLHFYDSLYAHIVIAAVSLYTLAIGVHNFLLIRKQK